MLAEELASGQRGEPRQIPALKSLADEVANFLAPCAPARYFTTRIVVRRASVNFRLSSMSLGLSESGMAFSMNL